jgi:hypothetical protein
LNRRDAGTVDERAHLKRLSDGTHLPERDAEHDGDSQLQQNRRAGWWRSWRWPDGHHTPLPGWQFRPVAKHREARAAPQIRETDFSPGDKLRQFGSIYGTEETTMGCG